MVGVTSSLWGAAVPEELVPIFNAGLEEISAGRLTQLIESINRSQLALMHAALTAALASGRVVEVCPDTVAELVDPDTLTLRINKEH